MLVKLAYGKTGYTVELPDNYNIDMIEPRWVESVPDEKLAIITSLRNPYNSRSLADLITSVERVAIVFSDLTRATPYHIIIPALLGELQNIPRENICFFCANGTHRPVTGDELVRILGRDIVMNYKIVQNDANDLSLHKYVGRTSSGNEIYLNEELLKYDLKILTGFIEPHFFAGFSGGGKALMPGMAYIETIRYNHSIANLSLENVSWGITTGNRLWEDIMEAAEFVQGLFLLNITLNKEKKITSVFSGDLRTAHRAGCRFTKDSAMVPVEKLYDIVITSNSGYPLDLNVYQTVKGMSAAAQIVKTGGHIIIASECWDGIPAKSDYEMILESVNSVNELMDFIQSREHQLKDTWQIFFQAHIQQRATVHLFSDKLDHKTIEKAFLSPVNDITGVTKMLAGEIGPGADICVIPEGPQTIPYLKK
jgi:nickel-dependent lactate racemase